MLWKALPRLRCTLENLAGWHNRLKRVAAQVRNQVSDRPKPLYYSTASQLGFHKTRGVPGLLDALLPPTGKLISKLATLWFLLLCICHCCV